MLAAEISSPGAGGWGQVRSAGDGSPVAGETEGGLPPERKLHRGRDFSLSFSVPSA